MKRRDILKAGITATVGATGFGLGFEATHAAGRQTTPDPSPGPNGRWSVERANAWYAKQPWIMGYNYVPSTAVNQLETWQAETFDPKTMDRELAMGAAVGLNTARIFLHDVAWKIDKKGFKERVGIFLDLCEKNKTRALVTFFTNGGPGPAKVPIKPGKQPEAPVGRHNPCWLQSPGLKIMNDPKAWPYVEEYVKDVMGTFAKDERILCWCLYNEPENERFGEQTVPLMRQVWNWAREIDPIHPLTAPIISWGHREKPLFLEIISFLGENSDIMSFHCYGAPDSVKKVIGYCKQFKRPIICTEFLARPGNDLFNVGTLLKEENIGAVFFGLVNGKCNFQFHWQFKPEDLPEPKFWFHDIFRQDGTPYDPKEIELIKKLTGKE